MREEGQRRKRVEGKREVRNRTFPSLSLFPSAPRSSSGGWTLIELIIVITVMSVLTLGVVPIVKTSVRRQKEQQLREVLREMRGAIDEFRRDTVGMQCAPAAAAGGPPRNEAFYVDPRSRVMLSDCKIFGVDNPDRYPPDLQTLVDGVSVIARATAAAQQFGNVDTSKGQATDNPLLATKKKVYLRELPMDPMTGEREWCFRSSYAPPDDGCQSQPENIFDVRSKSEAEALNGEKYSDW